MEPAKKKAYGVKAFCLLYSIGVTRLYQEIKLGRLKAIKVGKRTLITAEAADEWVKRCPKKSAGVQHG